jgi:glyoxylase-like metal-dependent hydrolase (beta-lactamase superfamily II)
MISVSIGELRVDAIVEESLVPMPFSLLMPGGDPALIDAERHWLEPRFADLGKGLGFLSFHTYLLRTPRHTILVDTCVGNDKDRGGHAFFHGLRSGWLDNLRLAGVEPEAVDFVLCTHMHADHIGWNTRLRDGRWVPTFPNARYVFNRREYEHRLRGWQADAQQGYGSFADSVLPVVESGQSLIVDSDHDLDGHVSLEPAEGHTPGNVVINLRSRGARAVLSGDVIHHPVQVKYPEWSAAFCEDPVLSAACRRRFVETHADTGTLILPAHFPSPTAGWIRSDGSRWRFDFLD